MKGSKPLAVVTALVAAAVSATVAAAAEAPSFDCAQAASWVERQICAESLLAGLDRQLAEAYRRATAARDEVGRQDLRAAQRSWARSRGACEQEARPQACLEEAYRRRLVELQAALPPPVPRPAWLAEVPTRLQAVDRCLAATPAASALVTGLAEAGADGDVAVQLRSPTGRHYQCLAPADGGGLATVQDAADAAGEEDAFFTRAAAAPAPAACRSSEPLRADDGAVIGWISLGAC